MTRLPGARYSGPRQHLHFADQERRAFPATAQAIRPYLASRRIDVEAGTP
jgi:hypothetical protein